METTIMGLYRDYIGYMGNIGVILGLYSGFRYPFFKG